MQEQLVNIQGRRFALTNPDKLLWPENSISKAELIQYYVQVYPYIGRHLYQRPLVVTRYPDGIEGESFYQKNAPDYTPAWVATHPVYSRDTQRTIHFILADNLPTLCWLANQACIELHPFTSRRDKLDYPDFAVIDLDPNEEATYRDTCQVALVVKHVLDELGLVGYPKTSGATGLHIYIPFKRAYTYETIRIFTQRLAEIVAELVPDQATTERRVKYRGSRVYVDYLQNIRGKTVCAPYSARPLPGAPVSAPLRWDELYDSNPAEFTIRTILPRLEQVGDLFAPVLESLQSLEPAWQRLNLPPLTAPHGHKKR